MKISSFGNKQSLPKSTAQKTEISKVGQAFSNLLDNAEREGTQGQLMEMVEKIKAAGSRLKMSATEANIRDYKELIKEYLSYVLKNFYKLKHDRSINYSTVFTRVEIINKEVDELTQKLLGQERDNLDIVAEVDRIAGLILDVYS
ncbi:YaaR family protein [Desulforamulus aquiferis]|nr:YaaR family protein [Desulforamulus aquiferis]